MNNRRKEDRKTVILGRAPKIPGIAAVVDKCLQVGAQLDWSDPEQASKQMDRLLDWEPAQKNEGGAK